MAATALTKVTAAAYAHGIADAGFQAVDLANDNSFVNTGRTLLLLTRAGGSVNPTFKALGASKYTIGLAATRVPAAPVTDGKIGVYGPFPTAIYGTTVTVGYDTGTAVTAAVVEIEATPL
ncbi:MAG TPA: hypothetical protein VJ754_10680 [Anaerolineae bacterium]|nr:hypothetical protein [Anaerolineae bacterium]